jgi:hypothetical protein
MIAVMDGSPTARYRERRGGIVKESIHHPRHPERICWGCDQYCPAGDLACGNGSIRTQHPCELFGDDWLEWADRAERRRDRLDVSADAGRPPRR